MIYLAHALIVMTGFVVVAYLAVNGHPGVAVAVLFISAVFRSKGGDDDAE